MLAVPRSYSLYTSSSLHNTNLSPLDRGSTIKLFYTLHTIPQAPGPWAALLLSKITPNTSNAKKVIVARRLFCVATSYACKPRRKEIILSSHDLNMAKLEMKSQMTAFQKEKVCLKAQYELLLMERRQRRICSTRRRDGV
jgi:hypothetical protein